MGREPVDRGQAPWVVAFTGLPGTGKSTLADEVARRMGAPSFAGDWLLGALKPIHGVLATVDRDTSWAMYDSLLGSLVSRQLMLGQSAVVDGLVTDEVAARWRTEAGRVGAQLLVVECVCTDTDLHRSRVEGRVRGIPGWHEIDWAHVERMRAELTELVTKDLVLDAVDPVEDNAQRVCERVLAPR